jgi:hypothetical protein
MNDEVSSSWTPLPWDHPTFSRCPSNRGRLTPLFKNEYTYAELTEPAQPVVEEDEQSMIVAVRGTAVLGITDPGGHTLRWERDLREYVTDIDGCLAFPEFTISRWSAARPEVVMDVATVPRPSAGNYLIEVALTGTAGFSLQVGARDASGGYRSVVVDGSALPGESLYYVLSNAADPDSALEIRDCDPAGIRPVPPGGGGLDWMIRPNPAVRMAEFVISNPTAERIGIAIFDVTGRRVATLVDTRMAAGEHRVRWNGVTDSGARVSSGVYWVRVESAGRGGTKRLVYIR